MPRCGVSNPATAKATQKELTHVQRCDFGHVPLAEIRIELVGTSKRCIVSAMNGASESGNDTKRTYLKTTM